MSFIFNFDFDMIKYFRIILASFLTLCVWINFLFGNNEEGSNSRDNRFSDDTLPVELIYFEAQILSSFVFLRWGTATEINNYGFNVERADTSLIFLYLGFVPGHGTSYSPKHYTFYDSTLTSGGIYYYRLKQIDTDGHFKYSDTISVNFSTVNVPDVNNNDHSFKLYQNFPNPFNSETIIQFEIPNTEYAQLDIFNLLGEKVSTPLSEILNQEIYNYVLKSGNLSSGVFIYQLKFGKLILSKKFTLVK